jgi:hypothetical protein
MPPPFFARTGANARHIEVVDLDLGARGGEVAGREHSLVPVDAGVVDEQRHVGMFARDTRHGVGDGDV